MAAKPTPMQRLAKSLRDVTVEKLRAFHAINNQVDSPPVLKKLARRARSVAQSLRGCSRS